MNSKEPGEGPGETQDPNKTPIGSLADNNSNAVSTYYPFSAMGSFMSLGFPNLLSSNLITGVHPMLPLPANESSLSQTLALSSPNCPIVSPKIGTPALTSGLLSPLERSSFQVSSLDHSFTTQMIKSQEEALQIISILQSKLVAEGESSNSLAILLSQRDSEIARLKELLEQKDRDREEDQKRRRAVDVEKMKQAQRELNSFDFFRDQLKKRAEYHQEIVANNIKQAEEEQRKNSTNFWRKRKPERTVNTARLRQNQHSFEETNKWNRPNKRETSSNGCPDGQEKRSRQE